MSTKFGQIIKASLLSGEAVVTKVGKYLIPRFDIKEEENTHLAGLKNWEQKLYHDTLEDQTKFSRIIRKYLASVHGILCGMCETIL